MAAVGRFDTPPAAVVQWGVPRRAAQAPSAAPPDALLARLRVALLRRAVLGVGDEEESLLAVDLGLRGVFVERREPLAVGTRVRLRFTLPGNERPITALGRVAWSHAPGLETRLPPGLGIEFEALDDDDRRRVRAFLLEHYTRAPRVRQFTRDWPEEP